MKTLSIKQPFAELILQGRKKIELRRWNTHFRREFLIHASKTPDKQAMKRFDFSNLPLGRIIGKATLTNVKTYTNKQEHHKDKHLHLTSTLWGNHGFILEQPVRVKNHRSQTGGMFMTRT